MNRQLVLVAGTLAIIGIVASAALLWLARGDDREDSNAANSGESVAWMAVNDASLQPNAGTGLGQPNVSFQPIVPLTERSISVVGAGLAAAPATTANLHFIIGVSFGMEIMPPGGPDAFALTREDLQPIVAALVAGGVPEEAIEVNVLPSGTIDGPMPYGGGAGRVRASVDDPTTDGIAALVQAATTAASDSGRLALYHVSAEYQAGDCAALQQEATAAALEDARTRAGMIAGQVGAQLGEVAHVGEFGWFGPEVSSACRPALYPASYPYEMMSPYDPSQPAEARVYASIQVTYAAD